MKGRDKNFVMIKNVCLVTSLFILVFVNIASAVQVSVKVELEGFRGYMRLKWADDMAGYKNMFRSNYSQTVWKEVGNEEVSFLVGEERGRESERSVIYVMMDIYEQKGNGHRGYIDELRNTILLFPSSSKLELKVFGDSVAFCGPDADLFKVQYDLAILYSWYTSQFNKVRLDLLQTFNAGRLDANALEVYLGRLTSEKSRFFLAIDSVMTGYPSVNREIYCRLKSEYVGKTETHFLFALGFFLENNLLSSRNKRDETALLFVLQKFYMENYFFSNVLSLSHLTTSYAYSKFLYTKHLMDLKVPLLSTGMKIKPTIDQVYQKLLSMPKGFVRDEVILYFVMQNLSNGAMPDWMLNDTILKSYSDFAKESIINLVTSTHDMMSTLDFTLEDSDGNTVKFSDFLGKVVIVDFWFTGCHGCITMSKAIEPVYRHFEYDDDVLFVNVSTDRNKETWKASVREGKYTHHGGIHLYTSGNGTKDPVIDSLGVNSYPTLVLIDKQGRYVSKNPADPRVKFGVEKLKSLIDDYRVKP